MGFLSIALPHNSKTTGGQFLTFSRFLTNYNTELQFQIQSCPVIGWNFES